MKIVRYGLFAILLFSSLEVFPSKFSINGNPSLLEVKKAIAGHDPEPDMDTQTTYNLKIDQNHAYITARLLTKLPENVSLKVEFSAPNGAISLGQIELNETEKVVVREIKKGSYSNLQITYVFSAKVESGVILNSLQNINYKLVDNG